MKIKEFWAALATVDKKGWVAEQQWGKIRNKKGQCPVVATAKKLHPTVRIHGVDIGHAEEVLGLSEAFTVDMVCAADRDFPFVATPKQARYRKRLMKILQVEVING